MTCKKVKDALVDTSCLNLRIQIVVVKGSIKHVSKRLRQSLSDLLHTNHNKRITSQFKQIIGKFYTKKPRYNSTRQQQQI